MKLSLEVLTEGTQKGKLLAITLPQFVIGRDPQCNLRPASPSISKRHCAILQRDGKVFVRDFDSTNGTFVNENQVKGEVEVQQGDRLRIGPIMFSVHLDIAASVNRPTPPPPTKKAAQTETIQPPAAAKKSDQTPMPPTKPSASTPKKVVASATAEPTKSSEDDDIAAMLLSMGDDGSSAGSDEVPAGSTVMDLKIPEGALNPEGAAKQEKEKEKPKASGNTQSAAKDILEKLMKRPR